MKYELKLILIICVFALTLQCGSSAAQEIERASITGTVVDSVSNTPLPGAHVFLSGTSIGTSTDYAGRFSLNSLPPGAHTLTVTSIGYGRFSEDIAIEAAEHRSKTINLATVIYNLGELYIGNLDEKWDRHLSRFEQLFIGETDRADSVTILNPEVLRFRSRWWGRFSAEALAPLQIENRSTGYTITYHLDEFYHSGLVTRWDGDSFFTPLSPRDSLQAAYWSRQREHAFLGSLKHFLLSLVHNKLEQQRFSIYMDSNRGYGFPVSSRRPVRVSRIVSKAETDHHYHLHYYGNLEIVYRGKSEESNYPIVAEKRRGPADHQTSHIKLDRRPVTIDPNGEIVETYGATRMGYLSYRRFAEALPKEYIPQHFKEEIQKDTFTSRD